jgi:hypothetical protein
VRKKEAIFIVLGALVLLFVTFAVIALNKPHLRVESRAGTPVSASELSAAYQRNEAQANAHYLNKALEVSGKIAGIDRNQDGGSMVLLDTGSPDAPVQCTMRDAITPLPTGAAVRLKGFCTGSNLSGVTLTDCIVAVN